MPSHPLQVVGLPYLHEVLKPVVNRIFEEKKYVELDPGKMELSRGRWAQVDVWEGHVAPGMSPCPLQEGSLTAAEPMGHFRPTRAPRSWCP